MLSRSTRKISDLDHFSLNFHIFFSLLLTHATFRCENFICRQNHVFLFIKKSHPHNFWVSAIAQLAQLMLVYIRHIRPEQLSNSRLMLWLPMMMSVELSGAACRWRNEKNKFKKYLKTRNEESCWRCCVGHLLFSSLFICHSGVFREFYSNQFYA